METALLNYFVLNNELHSTCDFNPYPIQRGNLVYEVIRVIEGKPLFLEEHLNRFFHSAQLSRLEVPMDRKSISQQLKSLIDANRMEMGNIEFVYHTDKNEGHRFMAWIAPFFYPSNQQFTEGVAVGKLKAVRKHPNAKAFNRNLRVKADQVIAQQKVYEVLLEDDEGNLTEGSRSNVFFVKDGALFTPPVSMVLPGVTRSKIVKLCKQDQMEVHETEISEANLSTFDACFLTGTSPKILPVSTIDGLFYEVKNRTMRRLMVHFDRLIIEYLQRFDFSVFL